MPRGCMVCQREEVEAINADHFSGMTYEKLRDKYGISVGALHRHFQHTKVQLEHMQQDNTDKNNEISPIDVSESMRKLKVLEKRADQLFKLAMKSGRPIDATRALKEQREQLELFAKIRGELNNQPQVIHEHKHLHISPEWTQLRALMLSALTPYPEARNALITALKRNPELLEEESKDAVE